jgi:hypothetical protein
VGAVCVEPDCVGLDCVEPDCVELGVVVLGVVVLDWPMAVTEKANPSPMTRLTGNARSAMVFREFIPGIPIPTTSRQAHPYRSQMQFHLVRPQYALFG